MSFALCATAILAFAAPAFAQMGMAMPTEAPKTLAENAKMIITDNVLKPGQSGPMGSRDGAAIYYVQGGTIELDYQDGTKQTVTRKSGTARISDEKKPYSPRNAGTTTLHVIVVQSK
jgi:hypothetical protein